MIQCDELGVKFSNFLRINLNMLFYLVPLAALLFAVWPFSLHILHWRLGPHLFATLLYFALISMHDACRRAQITGPYALLLLLGPGASSILPKHW